MMVFLPESSKSEHGKGDSAPHIGWERDEVQVCFVLRGNVQGKGKMSSSSSISIGRNHGIKKIIWNGHGYRQ